jgi:Spy/CpxP family protein refolding chaperone
MAMMTTRMETRAGRISAMAGFGTRGAALALCLAVAGTVPMMAQDASAPPQQGDSAQPGGRPSPNQMVDRQIEHLTEALSLTPDQVAQVKPILQNQMTQMTALRQDTETSREQKHEKMMQIHSDAQTKIRALLTSDQQPKYDQLLAQQQQHMGRRRGGMMNGGQDDQTPPPPQQ